MSSRCPTLTVLARRRLRRAWPRARTPTATATRPVTPDQPEAQRRLQGETEQVARRLGHHAPLPRLPPARPGRGTKAPDRRGQDAGGLTKNEMEAVIAHLEASVKAPDDKTANDEAKKAYDRHRDVVKNLKSLLLKYDTIKTLDQAAERLERAARDQNETAARSPVARPADARRPDARPRHRHRRDRAGRQPGRPEPRPGRPLQATREAAPVPDRRAEGTAGRQQGDREGQADSGRARPWPTSCLSAGRAERRRTAPAEGVRGAARTGPRPARRARTSWRR